MFKNITFLFDLDGTLVNTIPLQLKCYKRAFNSFGISISAEDFYLNIGGKEIFHNICKKYNSQISFWDWYEIKNNIYYKLIDDGLDITPGALSFIKNIKSSGYGVLIVSSSSVKNINKVVQSINIHKYIDFIIGAEETEKGKPSPDPYLFAIQKYKLQPDQCIAFEDTKNGIISAKKAGLFCVAISYFDKNDDSLGNADIIYENFIEIDLDRLIKYKTSIVK